MAVCRYHCRPCGSHFTSLVAFDLHRENQQCSFPDSELVEKKGSCKIGDPDNPLKGVTVYELQRTETYRKAMNAKS